MNNSDITEIYTMMVYTRITYQDTKILPWQKLDSDSGVRGGETFSLCSRRFDFLKNRLDAKFEGVHRTLLVVIVLYCAYSYVYIHMYKVGYMRAT